MHRPVLISPPERPPVTLDEAKAHMRVDYDDDDALIEGLVRAATEHLDGWTGILGRCLVEQTWRQDFDRFERELCLPLGPVISIVTVSWRNEAGQVSTVSPSLYDLRTDAGGRSLVRFDNSYVFPMGLHESRAVAVSYRAGYVTIPEVPAVGPGPGDPPDPPGSPAVPEQSTVPDPLKVAILLLAGHWYQNREAAVPDAINVLPLAVGALVTPYRRVGV